MGAIWFIVGFCAGLSIIGIFFKSRTEGDTPLSLLTDIKFILAFTFVLLCGWFSVYFFR